MREDKEVRRLYLKGVYVDISWKIDGIEMYKV